MLEERYLDSEEQIDAAAQQIDQDYPFRIRHLATWAALRALD